MLQPHDAEAVFQLFSDEKVVRFYDLERFESPDQAVRQINKWLNEFHEGTGIRWAIAESHSPENLIGTIGLQNISLLHRKAELGYDLLPIHWNRGIMGLCVQQAIRTGFEKMKLNRIEAKTDPRHLASQKVLLKNGFHLEGTLRQSKFA